MGTALLASWLLLAGMFLIAGVAKLGDPAGSCRAVVGFGATERPASGVGVGLPATERVVGVASIPRVSARFGALSGPMGVLIENGRVASPVAAGTDAVVALATTPPALAGGEGGRDWLRP